MIPTLRLAALAAIVTSLAACSAGHPGSVAPVSPPADTIAISVGPCFGFCPVYTLSVTEKGSVQFEGARHTVRLGAEAREAGPAAYAKVAEALAPYRPLSGSTTRTECDARISDQQSFRISWTGADGKVTTLDHDRGCRSAANDKLNAVLQDVPVLLGADGWASQVTRPGVSRG